MTDLHNVEDGPQLSFDVGGRKPPAAPSVATLAITGKLEELDRELYQDEMVVVTVADQHGQVLASAHGNIDVGFKRKSTDEISYVVREHKAVLG